MDTQAAYELVRLWAHLVEVQLEENIEDKITWPCSPSRIYLAKSTYDRLWEGTKKFATADCI
jgi:hypothetical protein